jgi:hypothetical protein
METRRMMTVLATVVEVPRKPITVMAWVSDWSPNRHGMVDRPAGVGRAPKAKKKPV